MNKNLVAQLRDQADATGKIAISTGYVPRELQAMIHKNLKRFSVLVCHRRFGKTVLTINHIVHKGLKHTRKNPQYAYIAPSYKQAKAIAWEYLKEFTKSFPGVTYHEQELRCEIPRYNADGTSDKIKIVLLGSENPNSIRGMYFDGVVLDEFAQCDPIIWRQVIRPALSDRLGWAIFVGTPEGQNHFYDLWRSANRLAKQSDEWYALMLKASETGIIPKAELKSAQLEMSESDYEQEYECSFEASMEGAYYRTEFKALEQLNRIASVPYDRNVPVNTYWDLGINDNMAVWFVQFIGKEIHVIDHMEANGKNIEWWVKQIKDLPYLYDRHYIPHDGAARELGTGQTRQERFDHFGLRTEVVPRQSVADGIDAVRRILPFCYFDSDKCEEGLTALKNHRKQFDSKKNIYLDKPLHDWTSDSAVAF
jgi:hypothetical protein